MQSIRNPFTFKMNIKILVLCLFCYQSVLSATLAPPPVIQTLESGSIGPEFNAVNSTTVPQNKTSNIVEDANFWNIAAIERLRKTVMFAKKAKETSYRRKAKNIIVFIGDGMGLTTITAGRIYKGQHLQNGKSEEETLSFDEFPNTGLAKTYNVDKQVPDSAGTATAMFCGVKTDYGAIGMDITRSKVNATQGQLTSIMDWAQAEGKRTGIVTTTRITHATPAATYARIYNRDWECDTKVPAESKGIHLDIAAQLVDRAPGNKFNVIFGGGLRPMGAENANETRTVNFEGSTESVCARGDSRNLTDEWLKQATPGKSRMFITTGEQLTALDGKKVDSVMGLFRNNHITYAIAREQGEPSLQDMVMKAIDVLERGEKSKGYVLMVEGGRIDQAHHQNYAHAAMREVFEFDEAISAAIGHTNPDETLIIVTADHSHSVTLNGYPVRGADILGLASRSKDPMAYETITYANGPGYYDHLANNTGESQFVWRPLESLTQQQTMSPTYRHLAALPLKEESHGGEDVIVFANGPGSSLVRGVFEQNFLAYIMSYAGCMGPAKGFDDTCTYKHLHHNKDDNHDDDDDDDKDRCQRNTASIYQAPMFLVAIIAMYKFLLFC